MKAIVYFVLIAIFAIPSMAQDATAPITDELRWFLTTVQVQSSLEDAQDVARTQTIKNTIVLATLYRDKIDLSRSISALRKIHGQASSEKDRRLALAALQAIGTDLAREYVTLNATPEQYEEGRLVIASVLNDYYLAYTENTTL